MNARQKWLVPERNLKIGDIVIIQEEVPRNEWPLGKVVAVTPDQQGLVRSVRIKLAVRNFDKQGSSAQHSIIERPVQKVVLLLDGMN